MVTWVWDPGKRRPPVGEAEIPWDRGARADQVPTPLPTLRIVIVCVPPPLGTETSVGPTTNTASPTGGGGGGGVTTVVDVLGVGVDPLAGIDVEELVVVGRVVVGPMVVVVVDGVAAEAPGSLGTMNTELAEKEREVARSAPGPGHVVGRRGRWGPHPHR